MKLSTLFVLPAALALITSCGGGGSEAAGTYELDTAPMKAEMEKELEGQPDAAKEMARGMMNDVKGTLELQDDETFTLDLNMGFMEMSAKGTWTLDGDQLTMTNTEEDGKKVESGDKQTVTYKDGTITMPTKEGEPPIVMKRK